jgi:hypothetical protein
MEVMQIENLNEVYHGGRTRSTYTDSVKADWLCELLMDLPIVEKPLPAMLMNCDNQMVIVKIDSSKDNMKSLRHIKR